MTVELLPKFFERYLDAWNTPEQLQTFYAEPFIAARLGQTQLNETRVDTQRFFDNVLAKYRSRGFASAKLLSFSERPLGVNSALATVRWAYQDHGGDTIWTWTFSYNLYVLDGRWQIILQTLHDE
ncbi:hypothetical protein [Hydrogenophaga sp.]|uniref:hypothetical protein n=1 Tax=Hydrogenophaga sp. TaxID=1904254 RepID=UPI003F71A324